MWDEEKITIEVYIKSQLIASTHKIIHSNYFFCVVVKHNNHAESDNNAFEDVVAIAPALALAY